ncbi:unnamed protein product, partial [Rotaria sp. Silwood2]
MITITIPVAGCSFLSVYGRARLVVIDL